MKLRAAHYAILFEVALWSRVPTQCARCRTEPRPHCPDCLALKRYVPGVTKAQLRARIDTADDRTFGRALGQLCDSDWHEHSPLLRLDRGHYVIAGRDDTDSEDGTQTGGWRVLADARARRHFTTRYREWVARHRNPATESEADLVRTDNDGLVRGDFTPAAIPTGSTVHGRSDPEADGLAQLYEEVFGVPPEQLGGLRKRDDLKPCCRCAKMGRFPWWPLEQFADDPNRKDGLDTYCKTCRAEMARERRTT